MNITSSSPLLAIIIPAYKPDFLAKALSGLICQSDQRFNIYVFDDASPADVGTITQSTMGARPYTYKRFEKNMGGTALIQHWKRCVTETHEPWIWMFSDDDIMEPDCVKAFYQTLEATGGAFNVYRFDSLFIDENDLPLRISAPHPREEGWMNYAYFVLRGLRSGTAQEAIFSRKAYEETGGWIDFPLGWGSDLASQMAWSVPRGLRLIEGAKVRWRWSGQNISSTRERDLVMPKIHACMQFAEFLQRRVDEMPDPEFPLPTSVFKTLVREWFIQHLTRTHHLFGPRECLFITRFLTKTWGGSNVVNHARLFKVNLNAAYALARNSVRRT